MTENIDEQGRQSVMKHVGEAAVFSSGEYARNEVVEVAPSELTCSDKLSAEQEAISPEAPRLTAQEILARHRKKYVERQRCRNKLEQQGFTVL